MPLPDCRSLKNCGCVLRSARRGVPKEDVDRRRGRVSSPAPVSFTGRWDYPPVGLGGKKDRRRLPSEDVVDLHRRLYRPAGTKRRFAHLTAYPYSRHGAQGDLRERGRRWRELIGGRCPGSDGDPCGLVDHGAVRVVEGELYRAGVGGSRLQTALSLAACPLTILRGRLLALMRHSPHALCYNFSERKVRAKHQGPDERRFLSESGADMKRRADQGNEKQRGCPNRCSGGGVVSGRQHKLTPRQRDQLSADAQDIIARAGQIVYRCDYCGCVYFRKSKTVLGTLH